MLAYVFDGVGKLTLREKPVPDLLGPRDALVKVTLASICTSDLHIKHGYVPRAVSGVTLGHEMVGVVEKTGAAVKKLRAGDRVAVNVETFCGECFFCRRGYVNNCSDKDGGWSLGCRIDGGQAEYVRVPFADNCLNKIPHGVSDEKALFTGDLLATGFWAAKLGEICRGDTVLIIGAGPVGICTLQCVLLKDPSRVIVCEKDPARAAFVRRNYPAADVVSDTQAEAYVMAHAPHGGADCVIEAAGSDESFRLAWRCARPNAVVVVAAMYERAQSLPLPDMYGKNLIFKTGGVDGCDCDEILSLIAAGKLDTSALITHTFPLAEIEKGYRLFESRGDGVIKVAVRP